MDGLIVKPINRKWVRHPMAKKASQNTSVRFRYEKPTPKPPPSQHNQPWVCKAKHAKISATIYLSHIFQCLSTQ